MNPHLSCLLVQLTTCICVIEPLSDTVAKADSFTLVMICQSCHCFRVSIYNVLPYHYRETWNVVCAYETTVSRSLLHYHPFSIHVFCSVTHSRVCIHPVINTMSVVCQRQPVWTEGQLSGPKHSLSSSLWTLDYQGHHSSLELRWFLPRSDGSMLVNPELESTSQVETEQTLSSSSQKDRRSGFQRAPQPCQW